MSLDPNEYERKVNEYRLRSKYRHSDQEPDNSIFLLFLLIMIASIFFLIFNGCN